MREVYLHPGQLVAAVEPTIVTTILGSCVAVCLWDERTGVGGMNHFLLPQIAGGGAASPRYGNVAMAQLQARLLALGAGARGLQAKLFGGASVMEALRGGGGSLGTRNVGLAREALRQASIPVVAEDVEGGRGRRLTFRTDDGSATVRMIAGGSHGRG